MTYSDSDSPLSSPPESEDEAPAVTRHADVKAPAKRQKKPTPSATTKTKSKTPALPPRSPSPPLKKRWKDEPPHNYTLADVPELAFIVMFRSRFSDAFKGVPNLGCQDLERGIVDSTPSEQVEQLLCGLISLCLNRKKPVERGHHNRALEESLHTYQSQWPRSWEGRNPMSGGKHFGDLDTAGRLAVLKALINWALNSSEQIRAIIANNYTSSRREDDFNVGLSVQPYGRDGQKRKYWMIEGRDDTPFRLYREKATSPRTRDWISVAGTIDELRAVATELEADDGTKPALAVKKKIEGDIPRFEEGEKRRQKREYRATRKAMFQQPSGMSLYEGRTRGKRIKYTFSDHEDDNASSFDDSRSRRSGRSTRATPLPTAGAPTPDQPRFTASGRQIRKPQTGLYGESKISSAAPSEAGSASASASAKGYNFSGAEDDADEWKGDSQGEDSPEEEEEEEEEEGEEADEESEWDDTAFLEEQGEKKSLRIILKVNNKEQLSRTGSAERQLDNGGGGDKENVDVNMQDTPSVHLQNGNGPPAPVSAAAQAG